MLLLAASVLEGNAYSWAAIAVLLLAFVSVPSPSLPLNVLSVAMALFCVWLFVSAALLTPTYRADGMYRPLILLGGFAAAAVQGRDAHETLFRAGAMLLGVLVLIGLLQFYLGFWHLSINPQRAAATFVTPNTFAAAINLFLLPLLALALAGRGGWRALVMTLWLFAGLLATESRGGFLGFAAGCGFIALALGVPSTPEARLRSLRVLAGLLAVFLVFVASVRLGPSPAPGMEPFGATIVSRGFSYRLELAAVAMGQILERPLAGFGANMFWPLYEMTKPAALDVPATFRFVHNDYLQVWLEYGLPGIVLLAAIVAAAAALIRGVRHRGAHDPLHLACGAAASGFFAHALVEYPLYIPFLLAAIGAWLGTLAAHAGDGPRLGPLAARMRLRLGTVCTPVVSGTLAVAALAWLAQPVLSDLSERRAVAALRAGEAARGLYWQSVARRLEPRNGTRHWAEGIIWRDQAIASGNKTFAARADALFAEAIATDPNEIGFYMERARLNRNHAELLEQPASPEQIVQWTAQTVKLRPYSMRARVDHARSLAHAGRRDEARRLGYALLARYPDSDPVLRLASDLQL